MTGAVGNAAGASRHRYARKALRVDYLRAAAGAAACLGPLALVEAAEAAVWILGTVGAVFVLFGLRTALRHLTVIELSASGIRAAGPLPRRIGWDELSAMKLAFYTTRRRRRGESPMDMSKAANWMELKLKGPGRLAIAVESSVEGFEEIVAAARDAALARRLPLSEVTRANLDALGLFAEPDGEGL